MSSPYLPGLSEQIRDPAVSAEFERVAAAMAGMHDSLVLELRGFQATDNAAEKGLDTGAVIGTRPVASGESADAGIRWRTGPWLLNSDGNVKGGAVLRPPTITANKTFYAPAGIDEAIWMEIDGDADYTITRLKVKTRQHRFLVIVNRGSNKFTLLHTAAAANPGEAYPFEFPNSLDYVLKAKQVIVLLQDPGSESWKAQAYSAPSELSFGDALPSYASMNWFCGRADGAQASYVGIGQASPTVDGTQANNNQADTTYSSFTSVALAGSLAGHRLHGSVGCQRRHAPTFWALIRTGASITAVRFWIGLTADIPTNADEHGGVTTYVMFRYSTVAGDGGWVGTARDGTTQSVTATVASIAINTAYLLKIRFSTDGNTVYFSVNGGTEVALTSGLPATTTTLGYAITLITTDNAAKVINVARHIVRFT